MSTFKKASLLALTVTVTAVSACSTTTTSTDSKNSIAKVTPRFETRDHFDDAQGAFTDVDDPAIWVNQQHPERSIVAGTLKEGGMDVYNMQGQLLQHIPPRRAPQCAKTDCNNKGGRLNNADLVYNFSLNGEEVDLIVASDRGYDNLAIYRVQPGSDGYAELVDVSAANQSPIFSKDQAEINEGRTAYGLATATTDKTYAFVTQNDTTRVAVLELFDAGNGKVGYRKSAMLTFPTSFPLPNNKSWKPCTENDGDQPHFEGMVADAANNALYLGQEDVGLWRIALNNPTDKNQWSLFGRVNDYGTPYTRQWDAHEEEYICTLDSNATTNHGHNYLHADVEGLTLYDSGNGKGYLLVSSQGDNTVAVFDRVSNTWLGSFTVADGEVDAVNETDGMMVLNNRFPGTFEEGVLIMQDGQNRPVVRDASGEPRTGSNFKYVSWGDIARALNLDIDIRDRTR